MSTHAGTNGKSKDLLKEILAKYSDEQGAVIPIMEEVQHEYGYIPPDTLCAIADFLKLSPSQVYGVLSFYNEFSTEPPARRSITVCDGPGCHVRGAQKLQQVVRKMLGIEEGQMTQDGEFGFYSKPGTCLGICSHAPVVQVNHDLIGRVTEEKLRMALEGKDVETIKPDGSGS